MAAVLELTPIGHHQLEGGYERWKGRCDVQEGDGNLRLGALRASPMSPASWRVWRGISQQVLSENTLSGPRKAKSLLKELQWNTLFG